MPAIPSGAEGLFARLPLQRSWTAIAPLLRMYRAAQGEKSCCPSPVDTCLHFADLAGLLLTPLESAALLRSYLRISSRRHQRGTINAR